ncbi:MAG: hypothetical protein CMH57_11895 [Myxococcales bacterium]|nr:hypothetical protein [Myxococcales bacterium]
MNDLLYRIVERMLLGQGMSRNKNFAAFEDPNLRRATRIVRHLRSIQDDLRRYGPECAVTLEPAEPPRDAAAAPDPQGWGGGRRLLLVITHLRSRRTAYLTEEEVRLLRLDPEVDAVLSALELQEAS